GRSSRPFPTASQPVFGPRRCREMCVLQCPCGMVVSTDRCQARCIRCGRVLGSEHRLAKPEHAKTKNAPTTENAEAEQSRDTQAGAESARAEKSGREKSREDVSPGASGAGRHATLAQELLLVIIAAARAACQHPSG